MKDKIFLLSLEEYGKYKDNIPHYNCWWWLRSPYYDEGPQYARAVNPYGNAYTHKYVRTTDLGVVPVLRIDADIAIGSRIVVASYPWIVIDRGLAIAETPIAFRQFDEKSNEYETSEIKQFLFDWLKEREGE